MSSGTLLKAGVGGSSAGCALREPPADSRNTASLRLLKPMLTIFLEKTGKEPWFIPHCRAVLWVGHQHFFLRRHATRQGVAITQRGSDRGYPRTMYQRQGDHLEYHSRVIGMAHEAKGTRRHNTNLPGVHHVHA